MKKLLITTFVLFLFYSSMGIATAATITYTDRTAFGIAAGATTIEDFETFSVVTSFHTVPLDVGDFSISMLGTPLTKYNFIDIAPPDKTETDVNGTTNMRVHTNSNSDLLFTFDTAITSFGADFRSLNDEITRQEWSVDSGAAIALPIAASSGLFSFFGIISDTAFTSVLFRGIVSDTYGIDNVTYSHNEPVPEPATITLLGFGLVGLAGAAVRRRRKKKAVDNS